jgi:bacterioferritin-associated ferredoxin
VKPGEESSMVVCHCNAIRERDVRAAARSGASCPLSAYAALGRRPRCGQCIPFARELIAEEQRDAA